jgi:hypothetical protein
VSDAYQAMRGDPLLQRIAGDNHDGPLHTRGLEWGFCYDTGLRYVFDWEAAQPCWERDLDNARYVAARKAEILKRRGLS